MTGNPSAAGSQAVTRDAANVSRPSVAPACLTYVRAGPEHDAELRALLREVDMPGWVRMVTTRDPSYFAGTPRFGNEHSFIGLDGDQVAGMFACATHAAFVNGSVGVAGYLGALRVRPAWRQRVRLLREGFTVIQRTLALTKPAACYTAISTENAPARRLLETGLPGLPRYRYLNDLVTLALARTRARSHAVWRAVPADRLQAVCAFHASLASNWQFAPVLRAQTAIETGASFYYAEHHGQIVASVALWDRRAHQQARALGYRAPLGALLPVYNAWARLARRVPLSAVGHAFDHAWAAFLAISPQAPWPVQVLLQDALARCPAQVLSLGLHGQHPWLPVLRRQFRPVEYRTRLYSVEFDGQVMLDDRPAQPEVAVM